MTAETAGLGEGTSETQAATPGAEQPWPAARTAWYAIFVLAVVRLSAQLDLGILSLVVQPIKSEMHLSDDEVGVLLGFAFAAFHVVVGLPLATLVDRHSRRLILVFGVTVWSLMTALTGAAQSFWQLFFYRVGVGAAESVNGPATFSLIADYFPREKLPRAIAALNLGSIVGTGLSLVIGAVVIQVLSQHPMIAVPGLGTMSYWHLVFPAVGLPGLLIAIGMWSVPEPPRRGVRTKAGQAGFLDTLRYLSRHWRLFAPMFAAVMLTGLESGGVAMWRPSFFQRTYGWTPQEAGYATGITQLVASPLGLFLGAWLSERLHRSHPDANLRVVLISWCCSTPLMIASSLMPTPGLAVALGALSALFSMMGAPTQNAALQSVAPNEMRAKITALYLLSYTMIGSGLGPSFIAAITQHVIGDEAGLRYSLAGSAAVTMPLAILAVMLGLRTYGREIARLRRLGE